MPVALNGEINGDMFDRFSLLHTGFGYLCARLNVSLPATVVAAIVWEFVERDLKEKYPTYFPHPSQDSALNATGDVLVSSVGWWIGKR